MNHNIKVSILIPVYGVEKYIERCSRSLFEQTYKNIEYVFVNDCTKDKSIDILKKVMDDYPERTSQVKIIEHTHNRGLAAARNTAVAESSGSYIMHVDSDDWIESLTVSECVNALSEDDYDVLYFNVKVYCKHYIDYYIIPSGISKEDLLKMQLAMDVRCSIYGMVVKRDLYIANKVSVAEGVNNSEDYQVSPRLLFYAKKIRIMDGLFYNYDRRNENSMTSSFSETYSNQNWESITIVENFFKQNSPEYLSCIEKSKIFSCFDDIKRCILAGGHSLYYKNILLSRIDGINKASWGKLPFSKRMIFYLRNEAIAKLYLQIAVSLYICIKILKKRCL